MKKLLLGDEAIAQGAIDAGLSGAGRYREVDGAGTIEEVRERIFDIMK